MLKEIVILHADSTLYFFSNHSLGQIKLPSFSCPMIQLPLLFLGTQTKLKNELDFSVVEVSLKCGYNIVFLFFCAFVQSQELDCCGSRYLLNLGECRLKTLCVNGALK